MNILQTIGIILWVVAMLAIPPLLAWGAKAMFRVEGDLGPHYGDPRVLMVFSIAASVALGSVTYGLWKIQIGEAYKTEGVGVFLRVIEGMISPLNIGFVIKELWVMIRGKDRVYSEQGSFTRGIDPWGSTETTTTYKYYEVFGTEARLRALFRSLLVLLPVAFRWTFALTWSR